MSSSEEDYENPLDEVRPLYVQGYLFEPVLQTNNSDNTVSETDSSENVESGDDTQHSQEELEDW